MKRAFAAWMWSLGVVARSYRTVVAFAAFIALYVFLIYEGLGVPESSALLLILTVAWATAQLLAAAVIVGGTVSGAAEAAATGGPRLPLMLPWLSGRRKLPNALIFYLVSCVLVWVLGGIFDWINNHSIEVASFLTLHFEKPISHVPIEKIYNVVEGVLWIILSGFLLSFFIALMRNGWRVALKQAGGLLAPCAFRTPFLTSLLSVVVFGGAAYELMNWHPVVPPGFWDYMQMIVRFSLILILLAAGWLFWLLSLARLQNPKQESPQT
jgi:hypothetical protein